MGVNVFVCRFYLILVKYWNKIVKGNNECCFLLIDEKMNEIVIGLFCNLIVNFMVIIKVFIRCF